MKGTHIREQSRKDAHNIIDLQRCDLDREREIERERGRVTEK